MTSSAAHPNNSPSDIYPLAAAMSSSHPLHHRCPPAGVLLLPVRSLSLHSFHPPSPSRTSNVPLRSVDHSHSHPHSHSQTDDADTYYYLCPDSVRGRGRLYQPEITRLPSLLFLLAFTLSLIALTELACRRLPPAMSNNGMMTTVAHKILSRRILDLRNPGSNPQQGWDRYCQ